MIQRSTVAGKRLLYPRHMLPVSIKFGEPPVEDIVVDVEELWSIVQVIIYAQF